jgi:DNA-binding NtrC family response regulator
MTTHSVLIVEDNATKRGEIEKALPAPFVFDVQSTPSISQAYRAIAGKPYSLIILDMTFHVSQSAGHEMSKEAIAGIELLQFMTRRRIQAPVIVATQHTTFSTPDMPAIDSIEKLHALLIKLFPANYRMTVQVDLSEESWKTRFQAAVIEVLGSIKVEDPRRR